MKTIAIIGPTGMLGSSVYRHLKDTYRLLLVVRSPEKLSLLNTRYGNVQDHMPVVFPTDELYKDYINGFPGKIISPSMERFVQDMSQADMIINCAGVINRYAKDKPAEAFFINSALPHLLSSQFGEKLIHITTDCVYDGAAGAPYDEDSRANPTDIYGLTKSIGEPSAKSLVFRTSIIGPEIDGFVSLLEWVRKQEGNTIKGFTRHLWNGITTLEFGKICEKIIEHRDEYPKTGLYHIFSSDINKFDMLKKIAAAYGVRCEITPDDSGAIDRRLSSKYDMCAKLNIPSFDEMLAELAEM